MRRDDAAAITCEEGDCAVSNELDCDGAEAVIDAEAVSPSSCGMSWL